MTTIIFAHPWHGSFNKAILDTVTTELQNNQLPYQVIDLNKDAFNPVMTEQELALFAKGESLDPLVSKYQSILRDTYLYFPAVVEWHTRNIERFF